MLGEPDNTEMKPCALEGITSKADLLCPWVS